MICFNHGIRVSSRWCNSRIISCSLVWLLKCTKYSSCSSNDSWITPDESNRFIFCRLWNQRLLSTKGSRLRLLIFFQCYSSSSGARRVLPMGVAPEAVAEFFLGIGSRIYILSPYLFSCDTLGTIVLRYSSRSSGDRSPRVHEGVLCDFFYIVQCCSLASLFIFITLHMSFPYPVYTVTTLFSARGKM
jgi:hypothetical protein